MGYFRGNYLTPGPRVETLEDLNAHIAVCEEKENTRRIDSRIRTIAQDFDREFPHLLPLPSEPFETAPPKSPSGLSGVPPLCERC